MTDEKASALKATEEIPESEDVDADLPEVVVDTRPPAARVLKSLGLNAHEELLGEDKSARSDRFTEGGTEE